MKRILPFSLKLIIILVLVTARPAFPRILARESSVHQRKIEREHRKKERHARKDYEKAKKDHVKIQSKETRSMMKKSRKQAKKKTPMKAPGKKNCK